MESCDEKALLARVAVLEKILPERIDAIKTQMDLRFRANDQALLLQSTEISRRLELLNGEAARLREIQSTYFPRELADSKFDNLATRLNVLDAAQANVLGRIAIVSGIVAMVAAGLVTAVAHWMVH